MSADLERFVTAQDRHWDAIRAEIAAGRKTSHWMWYVFPQLAGLGRSPTAQHYALEGPEEARAYLAHPVLGARLRESASLLCDLPGDDPEAIFGPVDALKLRSSMTLFDRVAPNDVFARVLEKYHGGAPDPRTEALLG